MSRKGRRLLARERLAHDRLDMLLERLRGDELVTERCGFCAFETSGPLEQARERFSEHECTRPRVVSTARRRSGFSAIRR